MGSQRAAAMTELLPSVGWGDIATKTDLERLATREDMCKLEARIVDRMNKQLLGYFGLNVGLYGVTVAVLTLLR